MSHVMSRDSQTFQNTDRRKFMEKNYREMIFKDCKAQEIVSFLLRFQAGCTRL